MSVTVNCFEGLKIEKCACPSFWCCRRDRPVSAPAALTKGVVYFGATDDDTSAAEPYHVCVVQTPNRTLHTIGLDEDDDNDLDDWDFMLVDTKHKIVSLDGGRWPHLMHSVDNPRGQDLSILRSNMRAVCEPLVTLALTGLARQMHTICHGQNMTMFANPVLHEQTIIGVQLTYRPTSYTKDDVLRIITHCDEI
jgi:hypothetical protein